MHFLNKMFYINMSIYQTDAELNVLVYFDLVIWKRQVATNDIQIYQIACISPISVLIMHIFFQLSGRSH